MPRLHSVFWFLVAKVSCLFLVPFSLLTCRAEDSTVAGQKFAVHTVMDQTLGLPFIDLKAPVGWEVSGRVTWKSEDAGNPVTAWVLAIKPDKSEAVTFFPGVSCFWLQGNTARNRPWSRSLGQINLQPMPPESALRAAVLQKYRVKPPGAQVAGVRSLPDLPARLHQDPDTCQGIGLKLLYTENGVPMEEEFYALYYAHPGSYDGPLGHTVQINWGLDHVHSFKAPVGTLDTHRPTFTYVEQSIKMNPAWNERQTAIATSLAAKTKSDIDRKNIASIQEMKRANEIRAKSDAAGSRAGQRTESDSDAAEPSSHPSTAETFDEVVINENDTVNDPYTGTSKHSNKQRYHWTDGFGHYQDSDDPNFNPNIGSSVTWTLMTRAE